MFRWFVDLSIDDPVWDATTFCKNRGQRVGIKEADEGIWVASFMSDDLGYIDLEQKTLRPLDNPFGTRLSPMSQVRSVTHVSGSDNCEEWRARRDSNS